MSCSSYLLPDGLDGAPEGLVERLGAPLGAWPELPAVAPEDTALSPEAARFSSRSHPASSAPESASETAAANAVTFMLTSVVGVSAGQQYLDQAAGFIEVVLYTDQVPEA
jgi:hypothetical protein